jgi:hypothetical protein
MYTITIESYREFADRHGNRPLNVAGQLLFADGASCLRDGEGRQEPPRDAAELVRVKLRYWREAVKRSTADFDSLKSECARQAELATRYSNLPGPSNAALADLHWLKGAVEFARKTVAELEKELAAKAGADPESQRRRFREQYERDEQARAAALLGEIASITI